MVNLISTILIVIVASWLMKKLASGSKKLPPVDNDGEKILRYPKIYAIIGWIGIIFTMFLAIMGIFFDSGPDAGKLTWLAFPVVFSLIGIPMILLTKNSLVVLGEEKIEHQNIFRNKKIMYWKDIKSIEVQRSKQIVFRDDHQKIEVNYSIIGFQGLLDSMKEKLSPEIIGDAFEKINKYYEFIARK